MNMGAALHKSQRYMLALACADAFGFVAARVKTDGHSLA